MTTLKERIATPAEPPPLSPEDLALLRRCARYYVASLEDQPGYRDTIARVRAVIAKLSDPLAPAPEVHD